jgi:serine phosphatase RsbU (regulator of sigma subunit)
MPRDIVSGDFYWFSAKAAKIILIAADCTGHGVPGAFMTMISNQLLYEIIENKKITDAAQILNYLHRSVRKVMKQDETGNREGMDLSLVVIDKEKKTMEFAGAKNPLIYIQDGKLNHIKGDRVSIGGEERAKAKTFGKHIIDISVPTTFYLFSDGYQDQFGGKNNRKIMLPKMKELFLEIYKKEMATQKNILESTLKKWTEEGNEKQIDDILVIGCSLNF